MSLKQQRRILNPNSDEVIAILADRLNRLCEFLNDEYSINSGGCCFVAYCLARLLKKDKFKFKVVVFSDYRIKTRSFADLPTNYSHYGIKLGDVLINAQDYDDYKMENTFSKVKISDLLNHYKDCRWNTCYNHSKNTFISKTLKVFYDDLTEDLREGWDDSSSF